MSGRKTDWTTTKEEGKEGQRRVVFDVGDDGLVEMELQQSEIANSGESLRDLKLDVALLQQRIRTLESANNGNHNINNTSYTNYMDVTDTTVDSTSQSSGGSRPSSMRSMNVSSIFSSFFGRTEEQQEEENHKSSSDTFRDPEMSVLLAEMNSIRADMAIFQKKSAAEVAIHGKRIERLENMETLEESVGRQEASMGVKKISTTDAGTPAAAAAAKPRSVASIFGCLFRLTEEEEELTDQQLHEDTYSFIMVSQLCSYSFVLGMLVFLTQQVVFLLMLWSLTGYDPDGNPQSGNLFGIPVNVDPQVRLVQMVALGFIVVTQTDVIKGLDLLRLISNESFHEAVPHIQTWRIALCIITLLVEGSFGILVSFMLIVTSENIVFLLLNFTAMAFVSELDEAVFFVTRYGFFGVSCEADAAVVNSITYKVYKKSHRKREIRMLAVMFAALVAGWGVVVHNQNQGVYQCSTLFVQFGDDIMPALGTFSGMYDLQKPERQGVLKSQYMVYVERRSGRASFAYCHDLEAWTFRWHEEGDAGVDPCDSRWVAMSTKTRSYDITTTESKTWYARDKYSRVVVLDPFYLACYDCLIGGKKEDCNGRGKCHDGICKCQDGSFGLRCEFLDPCPLVARDARTVGFMGTRPWSNSYERLHVNAIATDAEEQVDMGHVEVYNRPIYVNETKEGNFDLIFFTGRRWVVTYSDFLLGVNSSRVALATYFLEDFHAHWSQFEIAFVSEPVDIATPSDANSPLDLKFYHAVAKTNTEQIEIQGVDGLQSDVRLLCAVCDNETNPCAYDGQCIEKGSCVCPMSTGSLCEIPPVGNGFCNPYFNSREFNYDGGDCCAETCQSDAEYDCGMDSSGFGSIGYYNCTDPEFPPDQWTLSRFAWDDYNGAALSDDGQFLVVSSSSRGRALMFDKIGKDWVQRGAAVVVNQGPKESHGGRIHLAVTSLAPMMVTSHAIRPPYLVLLPELHDSDDSKPSKINFVLCQDACTIKANLEVGSFIDLDVVYAISTDVPRLALRTHTGGHQTVKIYSLHDGTPSFEARAGEYDHQITSLSLSASGKTLAVQSSKKPWGDSPPHEIHIYDLDGATGRYRKRSKSLKFHGVHQEKGEPTSQVVISGDGTTIAFTEVSSSGSAWIKVQAWDQDLKNWTQTGRIPISNSSNHPGLHGAAALSRDGRILLHVNDTEVSVSEWDGVNWSMVGGPVSSSLDPVTHMKSVAMSGDGSVVAVGIVGAEEAESVRVLSIPNQRCPRDMSLLRVSVTSDKQPDTKSWSVVEKDSGMALFQHESHESMYNYESATFASQSCIKMGSCQVLSLYAHGLDDFQSPGGYHLTLDGVSVGSEKFQSDSFNVAKRVFVGNCLSCEAGKRLFRFLLTTCETTASWELEDSFGKLVFSGNSSTLENDLDAKRLCAKQRKKGEISYVVQAPFWEETCIDPNECYNLRVSSPGPRSTRTENRTRHYYVFDDDKIISEEESSLQESIKNPDDKVERSIFGETEQSTESVTAIGNCAPTSQPSTPPTLSAEPTAPTALPSHTPSEAPTRYHISLDDPEWPGAYPNDSNAIIFNLRTDYFPYETEWIMSKLLDVNREIWDLVDEEELTRSQRKKLVSYNLSVDNDSIYRLKIIDTDGDGLSAHSGGWLTVTSALATGDNPNGTVVWEWHDDSPTEFEWAIFLYLWIDENGYAHQVKWMDGRGFAFVASDGTIPEDPRIVTPAPTVSLAPSVSPEPTNYPTVRPFDPKLDDQDWPGEYPTPVNATNVIGFNIRTDRYPQETKWKLYTRDRTGWTLVHSGGLKDDQAETLVLHSFSLKDDSTYKLEITDSGDDGTCCNHGNGWMTVTSAATSQGNPNGTVLWEMRGDEVASGRDLYLKVDTEGHVQITKFLFEATRDYFNTDEYVTVTFDFPTADSFWIIVYPASQDPNDLNEDDYEDYIWSCGSWEWPEPDCAPESSGTVKLDVSQGEWVAFAITGTDTEEPYSSFAQTNAFFVGSSLPVMQESFKSSHISVIDPNWPGRYPDPANASGVITLNIRTDQYPEEIKWMLHSININDYLEGKEWSLIHEGGPRDDQVESVVSHKFDLKNNSIYEFFITDTGGDGICCGIHGTGWFTVTSAFTTLDTPEGTLVGEFYGGKTQFASEYHLHLWVDSVGYIRRAGWVPGQGYLGLNADGSLPEHPMILVDESLVNSSTTILPTPEVTGETTFNSTQNNTHQPQMVNTEQPTSLATTSGSTYSNSILQSVPSIHPSTNIILETTAGTTLNNSQGQVAPTSTYEISAMPSYDPTQNVSTPLAYPTTQPSSEDPSSESDLSISLPQEAATMQPTSIKTLVPQSDSNNHNSNVLQSAPTVQPTVQPTPTFNNSIL